MSLDATAPEPHAVAGGALPPHVRPLTGPWRTTEVDVLRRVYPQGGSDGVRAQLPWRTLQSIRAKANALGVRCRRASTQGMRFVRRFAQSDAMDQAVREGYAHARRKGDIQALALRLGRPYWWVQKRGAALGCTRTNATRLDAWTREEEAIVEAWSVCTPKLISTKLRQAGYQRTEAAVALRLKRGGFDREDPDRWSATQLAPLLGVNAKTVADWIERRGLRAVRENWGPNGRLMITRKELRRWIAEHPRWVDLRKVEQLWFMDLAFGTVAG